MKQNINEAFSPEESKEIYDKFLSIVGTRRDNLVKRYGSGAEQVAYATAVNQVKKKAANKIEEPMEDVKLKEMVKAALSKPLDEKKKSFPDLTGDGKVTKADILKARGVELEEDLDLGHQDNEPHMIKAELAQIGKYAMELYKMVDQFEGEQEVDFPGWWQAKITTAKNMVSSAKHYLDFELEEPKIDAMVGVASEEGAIGEEMTPEESRKKGMPFKDVAIDEKLKPSMGIQAYIKDFIKSDDPKFKGESKKERIKRAAAAFYQAKK
jgi:hypothetical protein